MAVRPRYTELAQIGITGMRDSYDPTTGNPKKAQLIQNAYPQYAEQGGGILGRPGFRLFGTQLGSAGNRRGQLVYQYTKQNGTEYTLVFVGGLMYSLNWAARTISAVALGGGVVVNANAKLYAVTFNDKVIVSDGVNKPWSWDGTSFTSLTNAPVVYGQPVVHYAKLVVINAANRLQIQWSEELAENTGYSTAIYDDTWTLGQAGQDPLYALFATNEGLYYWRARSIGAIYGSITRSWRTDGTRAGVSGTIGTTSPGSVTFRNNELWFLDADSRAHVLAGGEPAPVWEDLRETTRQIPRLYLDQAVGVNYTPANLMLIGVPQVGSTVPNMVLAWNPESYEAAGVWRGFNFQAMGMAKNESLVPVWVHLSDDGYVYDHGNPEDSIWDDGHAAGTTAISHIVKGTPQGWDAEREIDWSEFTVIARADSAMHLNLRYTTPRSTSNYQAVLASGGFAVYGSAVYGVALYAASTPEVRKKVGIKRLGRWIQPEVQHQYAGERFGLLGWNLGGYQMPAETNVP